MVLFGVTQAKSLNVHSFTRVGELLVIKDKIKSERRNRKWDETCPGIYDFSE